MGLSFPEAARRSLANTQLRANLARATTTIRDKRARVVGELPDWEDLRAAGAAIKDEALLSLDEQLSRLEAAVVSAGGVVHWANDGAEACAVVARVARSHGISEVVKVKSIATDEIGLNDALAASGIRAVETDLAELIIQLRGDRQSHILVPAIHLGRAEIRDLFRRELDRPDLTDSPPELTEAARLHLREKFLGARMGVSGANFAVAETGSVCVVESEGNGRMCTTLPEVLVTVMGVEKVVPRWRDLEVFLQLLPRSSTGERMNPYTSLWTGPGDHDGPREFHLVLLDNGRTGALADEVGRQALRCIRCSACLNVCPVYSRVGGHAYESVYPGPIGAILTPQLRGFEEAGSLPYASSLCGACADVCPVKIEIPRLLIHLRSRERAEAGPLDPEKVAMRGLYRAFSSRRGYERAQRLARSLSRPLARDGRITRAPGPLAGWTSSRDLPAPAKESFRDWWRGNRPRASTSATLAVNNTAKVALADDPDRPSPPPTDPRAAVLARITTALERAQPPTDPPRAYRTTDDRERPDTVDLFAERVAEYKATVHRVAENDISATVAEICHAEAARRLGIPPDLPAPWRPDSIELSEDEGLSPAELDGLDGALTACAVAIAETGTFVLDGGPTQGRRALTLVPDLHVCVVRADEVVGIVPEAVARLEPAVRAGRALTFVSGPSATSDIELDRVEGVHGPRILHVLVVG
ncbi:MAG TPA: LutB/LldF family L-lactate oxidation iron-sulfur protein [Thermoleophilaceae bacterium]|nr:LutB/LldF family L-lactate oxidation iron-sulfur protein [Thermoleophilaceae bacterium]